MTRRWPVVSLVFSLPLLCACPQQPGQTPAPEAQAQPAAEAQPAAAAPDAAAPDAVFVSERPAGAEPLLAVKQRSKVGDQVVFEARVGGRAEPFVSKRAIVTVIDPKLASCADEEGDSCAEPWDYCCETAEELVRQSATVRVVDGAGQPLADTLEGRNGLAGLKTVVVQGTVVEANEAGVFVVDATGVWVAP